MSKTTSNRVCVGMYGFIRDCIPKYIDITNFLMMLDPTKDTIFDVFIVCPYLKFETDEFVEEKKRLFLYTIRRNRFMFYKRRIDTSKYKDMFL